MASPSTFRHLFSQGALRLSLFGNSCINVSAIRSKEYNLWMIGARPVADGRGIVSRVEPVSLEELGRRGLMS
ncbi:hypothetical protein Bca4012_036512 [Brassica carinata]